MDVISEDTWGKQKPKKEVVHQIHGWQSEQKTPLPKSRHRKEANEIGEELGRLLASIVDQNQDGGFSEICS